MSFENVDMEEMYRRCGDKLKKEHVYSLREWLKKQPHLPQLPEFILLGFLHAANSNNEKAKRMIDTCCTVRTHFPEVFTKLHPNSFKGSFDIVACSILSKLTPEGYHVVFAKILTADTTNYVLVDMFKHMESVMMVYQKEIGVFAGQCMVIDVEKVNFGHVTKSNPLLLRKFFFYIQDGLPHRIRAIHMLHANSAVEKIFQILKPFLNNDFFNLFHFHSKLDSLLDHVPLECLPADYGGECEKIEKLREREIKHLYDNAAVCVEMEKLFVVDESKRPGKPKTVNDIFGIEGTFKKLDID